MAKRLLLFSWVAVCLVCQSRPEPERFAMLMNAHFPALPGTFQTSYGQAPKQGSYQALQKPLAGYSKPYRQWAEGYAALHNAKPKIAIQALSQARQSLGPLPNLINDLALAHYKAWEAQPRLDDLVIALDLWLSLGTLPANEEAPSITLNLRRLNEKRTHTEPAGPEVLLNPLGAFLIEASPDPEPFQRYGDQSLKLWQSQQKTGYPAYAELVTWLGELDRQNLERSEDTIRALEARFRDPLGLAWFHYASGLRAYYELRPDSTVQHLNSALELAKTHGLIGLEARSEHLLGLQLTFSGAFQAALEPLAEAGATYQKLGFRSASVRMQSSVAYCLEQMGQENQAEQIKSRLIVNQWREVGLAGMDFSLFGWLMRCGRDLGAKFLVAHLEKCQLERMPKERKPLYVQQSIRLALAEAQRDGRIQIDWESVLASLPDAELKPLLPYFEGEKARLQAILLQTQNPSLASEYFLAAYQQFWRTEQRDLAHSSLKQALGLIRNRADWPALAQWSAEGIQKAKQFPEYENLKATKFYFECRMASSFAQSEPPSVLWTLYRDYQAICNGRAFPDIPELSIRLQGRVDLFAIFLGEQTSFRFVWSGNGMVVDSLPLENRSLRNELEAGLEKWFQTGRGIETEKLFSGASLPSTKTLWFVPDGFLENFPVHLLKGSGWNLSEIPIACLLARVPDFRVLDPVSPGFWLRSSGYIDQEAALPLAGDFPSKNWETPSDFWQALRKSDGWVFQGHLMEDPLTGTAHIRLSAQASLTPTEVQAQNLDALDWVVLAACRSGAQKSREDNFSTAFLAAGVHGVIATLWPVRDDEAAALMADFLQLLGRGIEPHHALLEASKNQAKKGGRDWAAFRIMH